MMIPSKAQWFCLTMAAAGVLSLFWERDPASGMGDQSKFVVAQVQYRGGNWSPRPGACRRLMWEVVKRTSIDAGLDSVVVRPEDKAIFSRPFLYIAGDEEFDPFTEAELANLRAFLTSGGTLLGDDAGATPGQGFDKSFRLLVSRLFPDKPLAPLPRDHAVLNSFYLLDQAYGRTLTSPAIEGVSLANYAPVLYCQNDLGGAWARDNLGNWEYEVAPGGERQREMAFRLGVNLVMYVLTVDYKKDQVHIPFIQERRGL
jgi:hypothetical protein